MKVLLIAPEPFYEDRGTPISVELLARALCDRGDTVDILTTHLGEDRVFPGFRILRVTPPFAPKRLPPGLSLAKMYCDVFMLLRCLRIARRPRYDIVHAVEESSFMAWVANLLGGPPYVVDIDSSMTTQIIDGQRWLRWAERFLSWLEGLPLRRAVAAVPMCEALAEPARSLCRGETAVIPDVSLSSMNSDAAEVDDVRQTIGAEGPIVMYVGNLEPYQGIGLLLDSFAVLTNSGSSAHLVIIGGSAERMAQYQRYWDEISGAERVHFIGPRPVEALAGYLQQADVLVSPRSDGVNTPLKIYSYLDSGRPVVATDLPTHNQVLHSGIAKLAAAEPGAFAKAIDTILGDKDASIKMAAEARQFIAREHSPEAFNTRVHGLYERIERSVMSAGSG